MVDGEDHLRLRGEGVGLQGKDQLIRKAPPGHQYIPTRGSGTPPGVGTDRTARVGGPARADCIDTAPEFEEV